MLKLLDAGTSIPASLDGKRLDKALMACLPGWSLRSCRRLCTEQRVLIQKRPASPGHKVHAGDWVEILCPPEEHAVVEQPTLVCHNVHFAFVGKPSGLPSVHLAGSARIALEDTLPEVLAHLAGEAPVRLLNRLDNETSGLVIVALDDEGLRLWNAAENSAGLLKYYLAVAQGHLAVGSQLLLDAALDTNNRRITRVLPQTSPSIRHTSVISLATLPASGDSPRTLLGCRIFKGARHQIRAHLSAAGLPLAGDGQYGSTLPAPFLLHHARCIMGNMSPVLLPSWLGDLPVHAQEAARTWLEK